MTSVNSWVNGTEQQVCITSHHLEIVDVTVAVYPVDDVINAYNSTDVTILAGQLSMCCRPNR